MLRRFGLGRSGVAPAVELIVKEDFIPLADRTFDSDDHPKSSADLHRTGPDLRPNDLVTQTGIRQSIIAARASHEKAKYEKEQTIVLGLRRMRPLQQVGWHSGLHAGSRLTAKLACGVPGQGR